MTTELAFLKMTGLLAAELALVVLLALISEMFVRSAQWRRTIWQVCGLSVLLVTMMELSGVAPALGESTRREPKSLPPTGRIDPVFPVSPQATFLEPVVELPPVIVQATPSPRSNSRQLVLALAWVWIFGTGTLLSRMVLTRTMLLVTCRRGHRVDDSELIRMVQELASRLGIGGRIHLIEFARLGGPIAFGLIRRIVGLPPGFKGAFSRTQQEVILAHELAHLAGRDSGWQLVAELATAAVWWHPLVWLARRRLRDSSETAADESSLLIQNGPAVLAECLLAVGKGMKPKPAFGWLNIGGDGFRSGLGRRVQRLFTLNARAWTQASRVQTALARMFCPATLVLGTVLCGGWLSPTAPMKGTEMKHPMWKRSLPAFALLAFLGAEQQATSADKPAPLKAKVSRAETKPAIAQKGKGAAMVRRKLEQITFSNFQSDNLPLGHVINSLIDESAKRDLEGVGVNLLLHQSHTAEQAAIDPATGLPRPTSEPIDLSALTVRIMPPIKNVRLIDVLDAIAKMADRPLKYSIEDYGVLISLERQQSTPTLETRTFQINPPDSFYKGIQSAFGIEVPEADVSGVRSRETQQQVFQELFAQLGIEWGAPRSIFFNEITGIVMVRAEREEMALIAATMQTLGGISLHGLISESPNATAKVAK